MKNRLGNFKAGKTLLSVALTAALVAYLLHRTPLESAFARMQRFDMRLLVLAALLSIVENTLIGSEKWRRAMNALGARFGFGEALMIYSGGEFVSGIAPSKLGDVGVAYAASVASGMPAARTIGGMLYDKVLNLFALLVLMLPAAPFAAEFLMPNAAAVALSAIGVAIPGLLLIKLMKRSRAGFIRGPAERLSKSLKDCSAFPLKLHFLLFAAALVFQFLEALNLYIILRAAGCDAPLLYVTGACALCILACNFPLTIKGIGLRENLTVALFGAYGAREALIGAGILYTAIEYIWPSLIGAVFAPRYMRLFVKGK